MWRGDAVVMASDLPLRGRRFESRPLRFTNDPGQVVHTHMCLCSPSSKNWYQLKGGDALC